jgi:hypothetical protein
MFIHPSRMGYGGPQDSAAAGSNIYIYIEVLKLAQVLELAQDTYIYIYITDKAN